MEIIADYIHCNIVDRILSKRRRDESNVLKLLPLTTHWITTTNTLDQSNS